MIENSLEERRRSGAILLGLRQCRGLKQADLAAAIGVSEAALSGAELGRYPVPTHWHKELSEIFNIEPKVWDLMFPAATT